MRITKGGEKMEKRVVTEKRVIDKNVATTVSKPVLARWFVPKLKS